MHQDRVTSLLLSYGCQLVIYFSIPTEELSLLGHTIIHFHKITLHLWVSRSFQFIVYIDCGFELHRGISDFVSMLMTMMVILFYGIKTHITAIRMNDSLFDRWLFYNPKDQDGQLHWLAETLLKAEAAGEKVHILGHIPSGSSECLRTWSREFHRIIDRLGNYHDAIHNEFNINSTQQILILLYKLSSVCFVFIDISRIQPLLNFSTACLFNLQWQNCKLLNTLPIYLN